MKGVILAGGLGSRLAPLTSATNKHLLPVFDSPMIFYPIYTLTDAQISEIMIVVSGPHAGDFISILKNGESFHDVKKLVYAYQDRPNGGIADALSLAKEFSEGQPLVVILGDNTTDANISNSIINFEQVIKANDIPQAQIFLKKVENAKDFGVPVFGKNGKLIKIEEKPKKPKSNFAVTGLYLYDKHVFDFIDNCTPSSRGELEITDVNNFYINNGLMHWEELNGFWQDAGSFENLYKANEYWYNKNIAREAALKQPKVKARKLK